jgi:hypothetical protein
MGKDHVRSRKYLFATWGVVDKNQHWDGELYPWTSGIDSKTEGWIGNTLQITWWSFSTYVHGQLVEGVWRITFGQRFI